MVTRVAETLAVAHAKGIIHRDIKPGNLILRDGDVDRPVLIDFGIARMGLGATITNTGVMLGTLGYMAPEQARGTKGLDARADVLSLSHCPENRSHRTPARRLAGGAASLPDPPRLEHFHVHPLAGQRFQVDRYEFACTRL